jgi:phage terminase large subunit-like protein
MNWILRYYQHIKDGTVTAPKWIHLLYARIIKDLEERAFFFDAKKADRAIRFMETFLHHSKGKLAPGLVKLEEWQKAQLSCIFGLVNSEGRRQFQEVFAVEGRKCGKSLLASGVAEYMAFGQGEYGADVYFIATKLDQADLAYSAFVQSIENEPELRSLIKRRRTDIYIPTTNTTIKRLPFSQKKSDGLNPYLTVCDELAAWVGDAGLKQYEVMRSALGNREEPLILSITSANYINDGIYDELTKRSTAWLMGTSKERRLLPFLYMIDDIKRWNDLSELQKSIPNLGVSVRVDFLLEQIAIAETSASARAEFITKFCCIKQNSSQAWLDYETVERASGGPLRLEEFAGCYCVGGIDLSKTTDLTAACIVIEKNGQLHVISRFFMPQERIEKATAEDGIPYDAYVKRGELILSGENHVDYHDVFHFFTDLVEKYSIFPLKVGYDRYSAQYLVADMKAYGFHMDDVYQGFNLTPVISETEGLMLDGKISIGDNQLLKAHLLNSALKADVEAQKTRLVKVAPRARIDGTAALLDALTVRQKWYAEIGEQLKNEG